MPKQFTIPTRKMTTEELYGILRHMPVRTLMRHAKYHNIETTQETVAFDLAQARKCFTILTFSIHFNL